MKDTEKTGILYGVGVGPGDPELVTLKAVRIVRECDTVILPAKSKEDCIAYGIMKEACREVAEKELICMPFPMTKDENRLATAHEQIYLTIKKLLDEGRKAAFLTIGDPTIYSTYQYIHKRVEKVGYEAHIINGVPSFCAAAGALGLPLYSYLGGTNVKKLPVPMMNIMNGGRHADNTIDIQEFMIMPVGAGNFKNGLQMCAEVYHELKQLLKQLEYSTAVGDEGGFAPDLHNADEVLRLMVKAVEKAGYQPGKEVAIALDVAASELYDKNFKKYVFDGEAKKKGYKIVRSAEELIDYYEEMIEKYPVVSIEDPLDEDDWEGWKTLTDRLGERVQLVGDDLFVTNTRRLAKGIRRKAANAILIKVNQIGTLTESFEAVKMAQNAGYKTVISHRSGETADTFIADIAVAAEAGQIKTGAPCRSERVEKYNQLLRIE